MSRSALTQAQNPPKYTENLTLSNSSAILSLAFSPDGSLLASGDNGGCIRLWNTQTGQLSHCVRKSSPALSLAWTSIDHTIHGGYEDGHLITIILDDFIKQTVVTGLRASENPVKALAADESGLKLATGGNHEVRIWQRDGWKGSGDWVRICELPAPPSPTIRHGCSVTVTSLHWLSVDHLLVSYLNHGIICWDYCHGAALFAICTAGLIFCADLSPYGDYVAISDNCGRIDVYDLNSNIPCGSHQVEGPGGSLGLPVAFVHGGQALLGADGVGSLSIWNLKTGNRLQLLEHTGRHHINCVAVHSSQLGDSFLIATASGESPAEIKIWKAEETVAGTLRGQQPDKILSRGLVMEAIKFVIGLGLLGIAAMFATMQ